MKPDKKQEQVQAFIKIKEVRTDAKEITALVKESDMVIGYQLCDGSIVSKEEGVLLAKLRKINGVGIAINKGIEYLKSLPDVKKTKKIENLPTILDVKIN